MKLMPFHWNPHTTIVDILSIPGLVLIGLASNHSTASEIAQFILYIVQIISYTLAILVSLKVLLNKKRVLDLFKRKIKK